MNKGQIVFSQVMAYLPLHYFRRCVKKYGGSYRVKSFSCFDQFLCMAFAQLTYRERVCVILKFVYARCDQDCITWEFTERYRAVL